MQELKSYLKYVKSSNESNDNKTRQKLVDLRMSTMMDTIEEVQLQTGKKIKFIYLD